MAKANESKTVQTQKNVKPEAPSVDRFTKDMERPIRVKVKNLESTLPVYLAYHFDKDKSPEFKTLQHDTIETIPLGAALELLTNQTIFNEKPKYDLNNNYSGKQGANHQKYSVQLLDPIDEKYIEYVDRRVQRRQNKIK